ncbi:MAG TPA: Cof-type HAD-IIB family hydrolase [Massilibacterium sp.]|nr:Cof-type HAD-IIB family hydrolase [Massilibacterium sp.]
MKKVKHMHNPTPYLIALDLDGTLLQDNKTISKKTKNVITRLKNEGHVIVIATGRPYRASEIYYRELGLTTPIVNFNGAFTHDPTGSFGTYHTPVDLSVAKDVFEICDYYSVSNYLAEVKDLVYLRHPDRTIVDVFSTGNPSIYTGDLKNIMKDSPTSLLIQPKDEQMTTINDKLKEAHAEVITHRTWSPPFQMIEIVKAGMNKAVGLQKIANYYHIPRERIIAFGDEDNDIEMLEYAGFGIAMGNAINELKSVADDVTKSNMDNGIAYYLEDRLFL